MVCMANRRRASARKDYVVVTNRQYGAALRGTRIYFEGKRPPGLGPDGRMNMGKHVLEFLTSAFERFRWIITPDTDSVTTERGITRVRTSKRLLDRMNREFYDRTKDIKHDIVRRFFTASFPDHFRAASTPTYSPGTLARTLRAEIIPRLSSEDRDAFNAFLPSFIATESVGTVNLLKATTQITTLRELARNLGDELSRQHTENWWQTYVKANILLIQQGYIKALDKMNVSIGNTKFPDFSLVTHDNYLDILEIKTPHTSVLKLDASRGNFYFDTEIAKAVIQTENYISNVTRHADAIRSYLHDEHKLEIKAVRPRGIILAGNMSTFTEQKQRDDFRLLSQGIKNITIVTYDELLTRLQNYIEVLEEFSKPVAASTARKRKARR